jgi:hypothetical protein
MLICKKLPQARTRLPGAFNPWANEPIATNPQIGFRPMKEASTLRARARIAPPVRHGARGVRNRDLQAIGQTSKQGLLHPLGISFEMLARPRGMGLYHPAFAPSSAGRAITTTSKDYSGSPSPCRRHPAASCMSASTRADQCTACAAAMCLTGAFMAGTPTHASAPASGHLAHGLCPTR